MTGQLNDLLEQLQALCIRAIADLESLGTTAELDSWDARYLGRNRGELKHFFAQLSHLSKEERSMLGQRLNTVKLELEQRLAIRREGTRRRQLLHSLQQERIDVTLPGRGHRPGYIHPVSRTAQEMARIFVNMGFNVVQGQEVETDYYNFQALNFPPDHPARDMQDTMWIAPGQILLRTQTSGMQIHVMEQLQPPVRVIVPGRVFRDEDITASNGAMFHQLEGLLVDEHCTMADLKGCLQRFVAEMFGPERRVRFRASYFPFTEPSAEMDMQCGVCYGKGCSTCKHTGWLELMGCGMVHPNVLRGVGYDPRQYRGFAFGMGIERAAMLKYDVDDIRLFTINDLRFLQQFA
jgi:phenylalanyl-tRNA synthetase alpha chain